MERSLDTVAHYFLTNSHNWGNCSRDNEPDEVSAGKNEENSASNKQSDVCVVICPDGFVSQASSLGRMLALSMAAFGISAGLIETTTKLPHAFFLSGGYENLDAVFWEDTLDSPDFMDMVARFRKTNEFVLINAAASAVSNINDPTESKGRYLVPTTVQPHDLLNAYGTMKCASKRWALAEIEFVVINQQPTDNAVGAATVLEKMARRFLPCSVRFIGTATLPTDVGASGVLSSTPQNQTLPGITKATVEKIARYLIVSGMKRK